MKGLICTDLVAVDNIKGEFCLYHCNENLTRFLPNQYLYYLQEQDVMMKKYGVCMNGKHIVVSGEYIDVLGFLEHLIKEKVIPERYKPQVKIIKRNVYRVEYYRYWHHYSPTKGRQEWEEYKVKEFESYQKAITFLKRIKLKGHLVVIPQKIKKIEVVLTKYTFKESIISLLIQKEECHIKGYSRIIDFLIDWTKQQGLDFEEYIERWVKRMIKEIGG